ncbi:MAG: gluconate 2-dehydrogenase subunit 3 family protein [Acidobacteria bacterium]|nr:gluconate 2-dehydrogenase subunit 3 family protein [Acidobacteriota bacterium]
MPSRDLTRREMLKRTVVAGAALTWPSVLPGQGAAATRMGTQSGTPFETLTEAEGTTLEAVVGRLIPSDAAGPGALEAGAARYIDRALAGALAPSLPAYRAGLAALDRYAEAERGARFRALDASVQDRLLAALESNAATGFMPSASAFFELLRTHTIEGTFSDPAYGGNADFIGWELLGYPGLRTSVPPDLQRIDRMPPARQVSAYDFPAFAAARARRIGGG